MSQSQQAKPTVTSAYAYTPKFELWYNGLLWQAIYNCVNAFSLSEVQTESFQGMLLSTAKVGPERFGYCVKLLHRMILKGWEDSTYTQEILIGGEDSFAIFQAILNLLNRRGSLRFKPPRTLADD